MTSTTHYIRLIKLPQGTIWQHSADDVRWTDVQSETVTLSVGPAISAVTLVLRNDTDRIFATLELAGKAPELAGEWQNVAIGSSLPTTLDASTLGAGQSLQWWIRGTYSPNEPLPPVPHGPGDVPLPDPTFKLTRKGEP